MWGKSREFQAKSGGKARADSEKQTINSEIIPCIPLEKGCHCAITARFQIVKSILRRKKKHYIPCNMRGNLKYIYFLKLLKKPL